MRKAYGKIGIWLLAAGMAAGLLGGCQRRAYNRIEESGAETQQSGPGIPAGKSTKEAGAMGRYRETEIELPQEAQGQSLSGFGRGEGGNLELYMTNRGLSGKVVDIFCYIYRDGAWESREGWAGNQAMKERGLDLSYVAYGKDGNYYLGGTDEGYQYHLLKLEPDGSAKELLEEVFKPKEGSSYGLIPPRFEVLEDGNIFLYGYWDAYLYEPSGRLLYSMTKDFSGNTTDARGFCEGQEFVTIQDGNVVKYNLRDGKLTETIACDEIKGGRENMVLFGDGAGGVYAANETGLSHVNKGGTLWEILIDGSLNRLGMRSLCLQFFLSGEKDDYYGVFTSEGEKGVQLCHYEYDPDMSAIPPSTLTVYSLEDHSTVRQAASQFQSEHPDIKVEVRTAVDNAGTATEEMIQGLNTELLSGKGADVLILDGLPADSYIEKGILMDLRGLVEEMEGSGEMLNNLLDGFREEDGAIYQVPARVEFPIILGEEKAVAAYASIESMAKYEGEKPLFAVENYGNLLRMVARLGYEELFQEKEGLARKDTLIRYLEAVKAIGEASGSKTFFTQEEGEKYWVSNHVLATGITRSSTNYDAGWCDSGIDSIGCSMDLCIPVEVRKHSEKTKMVPAGKIYLPSALAGINQSTANGEMAKEFIRCLLSYEVQKEELYDGFPVNREALKTQMEMDKDGYSRRESYSVGMSSGDGTYNISAQWPDLEARKEAAAMLETLSVPAVVDETMMKMIAEGSFDYFDNKETVEQAADKILRKLSIYLAE